MSEEPGQSDKLAIPGRFARTFESAGAFLLYLAISISSFAPPLLGHFGHRLVGFKKDPLLEVWMLAWWPHAVAHGLNPFLPRIVWPPVGYNLTWTTSTPGPALALWPVTWLFGPVVSYNILFLLCPAAAAFAAFLLCRVLTRQFWPSIVGGYVFGFSQYFLGHMLGGHVCLLVIFPVPLAIYLAIVRIEGRIGRTLFVALLAGALWMIFLGSVEIFASTAIFGALGLGLACVVWRGLRARIFAIALEFACACLLTALASTPYLYFMLGGRIPAPLNPNNNFSNDLLAFVIPTHVIYGGRIFDSLTAHFSSGELETAAYLGPGMLIVLVLYVVSSWKTAQAKYLVLSLVLFGAMSLGPAIKMGGEPLGPGPWRLFSELPLLNQALPDRFGMYFFLTAAVIASVYLSEGMSSRWLRVALAIVCVGSIAPNLQLFHERVTHLRIPRFFRAREYGHYLAPDENVLALPPDVKGGDGLLWQLQTDFYFCLASPRVGDVAPHGLAGWPILKAIYRGDPMLDFVTQLKAFLGAQHVKAILVDARNGQPWRQMLAAAGLSAVESGGLVVYRVPPATLAEFKDATPHQMASREAMIAFSVLVEAAHRYVGRGFPVSKIGVAEAERLNLLSLPAGNKRPFALDGQWFPNRLWLGGANNSRIAVGIVGDYQDLRPLLDKYGADAAEVYFPFPSRLGLRKEGIGQMVMVFTVQGLEQTAAKARDANP